MRFAEGQLSSRAERGMTIVAYRCARASSKPELLPVIGLNRRERALGEESLEGECQALPDLGLAAGRGRRRRAQDLRRFEPGNLGLGEIEELAQDFAIVLAEGGRRAAHRSVEGAEARAEGAGEGAAAGAGLVEDLEVAARAQVWLEQDLLAVEDRP